ncbi:MAG TPA: tRNA uridine-5-carboxymethylaminomethyl(34) synthesis GTPase MnmE [bacterium]|nr:tRNA uridine-5-carboxymethylaminomethyl(34) synthesis GTPase MnmE [bacterium]
MSDPRADTIAAVATAPGTGALSIVRVSGPRAKEVLDRVFGAAGAGAFEEGATRHGVVRGAAGAEIDDGIAWWRRGPHTFTGEDVAEFTGHGGTLVTARVLEAFLAAGARLAEPGEFTRRAFLNGRIDLARAEAVADVIAAATDDALRVARAQLAGGLSSRITAMRDEVLDALAHVEATVDFPDEDLHPEGNETIARRFESVAAECARLAETFRRGRLFREGARVVLCGRPNVGKSSLLNALVGRNRAIVTDEPGTTRDVIEEAIDLGGVPVVLADTAGIREAAGVAEAEGVRRSRDAVATADLVLLVFDGAAGFGDEDRRAAEGVAGRPALVIANKDDLARSGATSGTPPIDGPVLRVSATTGAGLDALTEAIRAHLVGAAGASEAVVVTRARHREALDAARARLRAAADAARARLSPDLVASDARRGLDALGEIVGAVTTEDLLGRIFEKFCVGK